MRERATAEGAEGGASLAAQHVHEDDGLGCPKGNLGVSSPLERVYGSGQGFGSGPGQQLAVRLEGSVALAFQKNYYRLY